MMMKKIKNIKQLQAEKKRIRQHREELEQKVHDNWTALKECLRPANIAKDAIDSIFKHASEKQMGEGHILKSSFTYGVGLLAKKFASKAGEKLEIFFRK